MKTAVPTKTTVPIKTDIFRFITFRTPEHLTLQEKNIRFVIDHNFDQSELPAILTSLTSEKNIKIFETRLEGLTNISSYSEVKAINPGFCDYANTLFKSKTTIPELAAQRLLIDGGLSQQQVSQLFQILYYQIFTQQSSYVRQAVTQLLIADHAQKNAGALAELGMTKLTDIKIEIPKEIINQLKAWKYAECGGSFDGVQSLGISDFRRVEQEVCCYVPGEVSHVENVMAREYKERTTRNFLRTENTLETTKETEIENLTDVTTATRNEISSEVANVLEQDNSSNYGGSLGISTKLGGAKIDVNAYADFATNNSSSYSNTEAKTYAEEVTKRALERIVQKTSEKRTSKIIKEFEENNKHGFDNRNGDKHVTGIYRWLDIIYTNRLVNYGKRLMVEFMVPEPAEFYKRILKYVPKDGTPNPNEDFPKPKSLPDFAVNSAADITRINFATLAAYYKITLDNPLVDEKVISKSIAPPMPKGSDNGAKTYSEAIPIEQFYETNELTGNIDLNYTWSSGHSAYFKMDVGSLPFSVDLPRGHRKRDVSQVISGTFPTKHTNSIDVNFDYRKLNACTTHLEIKCKLTAAKFAEWQNACYQKLQAAYRSMLADYNNWLEQQQNNGGAAAAEQKQTNPALNRIVEQRELKRICIEMLMKPFCRTLGRKNYTDIDACKLYNIPQTEQSEEFAKYAMQVKFFEQAIDWQIMSYLFYPYYWANNCSWGDLMQTENDDLVFQAFLQSGMARVVVPIRQQFTEAFAYYLQTGDIWLGNDLVAGEQNDLYLSIAEEMQTIEGVVEKEWETRVPTTLAIIQGKSAYLEQEGLPCCHDVENEKTTSNIIASDEVLKSGDTPVPVR
jgi:hypothetical protein